MNWSLYDRPARGPLDFFECRECGLLFKDPSIRLSQEKEREQYLKHENDPLDPGYEKFLSRLAGRLLPRLPAGSEGLDFGCGPTPAMARIFAAQGHRCESYDPFFMRRPDLLERRYDFITCSEAAEHFHSPERELRLLHRLARPGGWIAIMTSFAPDDLSGWWYHRDPTHVVFYRERTFRWIAALYGDSVETDPVGVALLKTSEKTSRLNGR